MKKTQNEINEAAFKILYAATVDLKLDLKGIRCFADLHAMCDANELLPEGDTEFLNQVIHAFDLQVLQDFAEVLHCVTFFGDKDLRIESVDGRAWQIHCGSRVEEFTGSQVQAEDKLVKMMAESRQ